MKILHITDSHATMKTPENRTDSYYYSFLRKLTELYFITVRDKIDFIIHSGDLFHSSRVSNKFMGQVSEIIKRIPVPFYVVPGNHDIDGYSMGTIDQTSLGLLAKAQVVKLLDREHPILVTTKEGVSVAISGQEYYSGIDSGDMNDFAMQQAPMDVNILVYHGYIADTPQHPDIKCTYPENVTTDADIILCGHYHRKFEVYYNDVAFYNPGSMMRVEMTDFNKTHMPQYGILEIGTDSEGVVYEYSFHKFLCAKPSQEVFDFASKAVIKKHGITLENFKNSIASTMQAVQPGSTLSFDSRSILKNVMDDYLNQEIMNVMSTIEPSFVTGVTQSVNDIYDNALKECTDFDLSVTKGFVPSKVPVKIKSVEIKNFQSHESTIVEFSNGLNIIAGESSMGKTAIFRAILWCIDNSPSGNAFITSGKKSCSVRITFNNGSYIERGRTEKSSGYYKIWDGNPQSVEQEYKGFSNNVPIEILNIHQMPMVSITKGIETHLNVMTQLEKPFLITDSVNEKAAAIGRITKTDVFDKAIKNVATETTLQERILKNTAKQEEEINAKLAKYDENAIKGRITLFDSIISNLNKYTLSIKELNSIFCSYENYCSCINTLKSNNIPACTSIVDTKEQVQNADGIKSKISSMVSAIERISQLDTSELVKQKNEAEAIVLFKDDINAAFVKAKQVTEMLSVYNNVESIKDKLNVLRKVAKELKVITSYSDILKDANDLMDKSSEMLTMYAGYFNKEYKELCDSVEDIKLEISLYNTKKIDVQTERQDFILGNGICPCCGQPITDLQINHIIKNMEEN